MKQPSFHDVEIINAYLDDALDARTRASIETRLADDPQLASVYQSLRESRALLRRLPQRRAPRNFTLTPKMAGIKPPLPRTYPVFRFASLVATFLFIFTFALNSSASFIAARQVAQEASGPMYGIGGGMDIDPNLSATAPEAAPEERPQSGGGCGADVCPTPEMALAVPTATPEGERMMATEEPSASKEPGLDMQNAEPAVIDPAVDAPAVLVPGGVVGGLFGVALLFGGAALFVRWRTDSGFLQKLTQKRREK